MIKGYLRTWINEGAKQGSRLARFLLDSFGYGGHWIRRAMNEEINLFLKNLPIDKMSAAEISGHHFALREWQAYSALEYPDFDICSNEISYINEYDILFCEQVLEHVWEPQKALVNLHKMLKPDGWLVVSTPFLVKIHKCPVDYWRFTPDCLSRMLVEADFEVENLKHWGNKNCVNANLGNGPWARYQPFRRMKNESDIPVTVWAYAKKVGIQG
mgnify:CR=1 FL=1